MIEPAENSFTKIVCNTFLFVLFFIFFSGCSERIRPTSVARFEKMTRVKIGAKEEPYPIEINSGNKNTIDIQYLGCGGFLISKNKEKILIDPFFSNPKFIRAGFSTFSHYFKEGGKCEYCLKMKERASKDNRTVKESKSGKHHGVCIKPKTELIDSLLSKEIDVSDTKALLISHAHYDHLLDIPHIYRNYLMKQPESNDLKIVGNESSYKRIGNLMPGANFIRVEDSLTTYLKMGEMVDLNTNHTIRVWPILSDHAPHFGAIKLYDGEVCEPIEGPTEYYAGTHIHEWREGKTLAFLVELIDKDTLRIFLQTTAACPKYGFLPKDFNKRIDLAIIGIANYEYACDYPDSIINVLNPKQILLAHWEDFFIKYDRKKGPKLVRGTDITKFILNHERLKEKLHMVEPLTHINLKY